LLSQSPYDIFRDFIHPDTHPAPAASINDAQFQTAGTDNSRTFTLMVKGFDIENRNFTVDADPLTVTDPTSRDSDGDGLVDGDVEIGGLPCELTLVHNGQSQTMFTDPSMQDTDGDGLSDGLEISGWEVHILKETTKEEVKNWTTYSNPTILDTDFDGLHDYLEFENQSDPLKNDTDGDYILDKDEPQGAITQIDGAPPWILKYDSGTQIMVEVTGEWAGLFLINKKLKLTVKVSDPAGIDYVLFKVEGQPDQKIFVPGGYKNLEVSAWFTYDEWRGLTDGWDVRINVTDRNGNGNETKTHINGLVEGFIKALLEMLKAFVDAVVSFLTAVWNWIVNAFKALFKPVADALTAVLSPMSNALANIFYKLIKSYLSNNLGGKGNFTNDIPDMSTIDKLGLVGECIIAITPVLLSLSIMTMILSAVQIGCKPFPGVYPIIITILAVILACAVIYNTAKDFSTLMDDLPKKDKYVEDDDGYHFEYQNATYKSSEMIKDTVPVVIGGIQLGNELLNRISLNKGKKSLNMIKALPVDNLRMAMLKTTWAIMILLAEPVLSSALAALIAGNARDAYIYKTVCKGLFALWAFREATDGLNEVIDAKKIGGKGCLGDWDQLTNLGYVFGMVAVTYIISAMTLAKVAMDLCLSTTFLFDL